MPRPPGNPGPAADPRRAGRRCIAGVVGLVVVVVLALGAGCAVGPSQRPVVATQGPDRPAEEQPAAGDVPPPAPALPPLVPTTPATAFGPCPAAEVAAVGGPAVLAARDLRLSCRTLVVPRGADRGLAGVVRVTQGPGDGPRVPVAVLGDPAARSGAAQAVALAATGPPSLLAGQAFYGLDRSATGFGTVDCVPPPARAALTDADPDAADAAGFAPVTRAAADAARSCSLVLGDAVTSVTTAETADDVEALRVLLRAPRLNVVALGDGAGTAAAWSERYPAGAGRTVLDALPDPTAAPAVRSGQQADAARAALSAFATDCTARPGCPLGPDPVAAVSDTIRRLRGAPLTGAGGRRVGPGTVVTALVDGLSDPAAWPATAAAVAAAGRGDPAGVQAIVTPHEVDGAGADVALLHRCNDNPDRLPADRAGADAARARATDPVFGSWFVQQNLACASWPVTGAAVGAPSRAGTPPLVLGTAADPRVPLPETQRVAAQLQGATLVTWLGAGHGAFPATPCVGRAVEGYLLRAEIPRTGLVCPP